MAEKKKEKSMMDTMADKYNQAAKSGYLGTKAKAAASQRPKPKKKSK